MIQKNWLELIKPEKIEIIPGEDKLRNATLVAQPLERGFGLTLGNALRRILLSSLQGSAVTHVKIKNVLHEFSTIPGVIEDVTDIILNIKSLAIKMHSGTSKLITLNAKGPGVITASKIDIGHDIEIMNPDLAICTLDTGAEIGMRWRNVKGASAPPPPTALRTAGTTLSRKRARGIILFLNTITVFFLMLARRYVSAPLGSLARLRKRVGVRGP